MRLRNLCFNIQPLRILLQMKEITDNNNTYLKSILIWTLFLVATIKTLELFVDEYYLLLLLFPGLLIFCFIIYYSVKTAKFLSFWRYLIAVISITISFELIGYFIFTYVRLYYNSDIFELILTITAACTLIPTALYWLTRLFKRVIKK